MGSCQSHIDAQYPTYNENDSFDAMLASKLIVSARWLLTKHRVNLAEYQDNSGFNCGTIWRHATFDFSCVPSFLIHEAWLALFYVCEEEWCGKLGGINIRGGFTCNTIFPLNVVKVHRHLKELEQKKDALWLCGRRRSCNIKVVWY